MTRWLQYRLALTPQGARDLLWASLWSTLSYLSLMLPIGVFIVFLDEVLNPVMSGSPVSPSLPTYLLLCVVCAVVIAVFSWLQYGAAFVTTYEESAKRRITLAERLRLLPMSFFGRRDLSDLTTTIMSDCEGTEHAFSHAVPQLVGGIVSSVAMTVGLCVLDWRMGLALLWVLPAAFAIILGARRVLESANRQHATAKVAASEEIQECLETVREITACNRHDVAIQRLEIKLEKSRRTQVRAELTASVFLASAQAFLRFSLATVVLVGAHLLITGQTSLLTLVVFLMASSRVFDPVSGALADIAELFEVGVKIERTRQLENEPAMTGSTILPHARESAGSDGHRHDIQFDHVRFGYDTSLPVLHDVSFTAEQGRVTALVGPSGGGKSTVARLAARFWDPQQGAVRLGDVDISTLDPETLLTDYAIVFQDVVLFDDSVRENIRIGRKDATDAEVLAAARAAQCDDFVEGLSHRYDTVIGENGSMLSGGERQRISIARAILKSAPVVILDEATASLDVESETQVQRALSHLIEGRTVLVIAHRMRTVAGADRIVVLDGGTVAEQGTPKELIASGGLYARMLHRQTGSSEWTVGNTPSS